MLTLLVEATIKGTLILVLAAALTGLMRERSAAARHLVWATALLLAAVMPIATVLLPPWTITMPRDVAASLRPTPQPSIPATGVTAGAIAPSSWSQRSQPPHTAQSAASRGESARAAPISTPIILTVCWLLVAAILLARVLAGCAALGRLTRRAAPVTDEAWLDLLGIAARSAGIARTVRLLASEETTVPMTWGLIRPVLLLPPDHGEWSDERRRAVLIHELAHVARRDSASQIAAQISCALYWFNPMIWLAARALRSERERACDDRVLAAGTAASAYAGELLEIARTSLGLERHPVALAMARRSEVEGRLLAILDPRIRRGVPRGRAAMMFGAAAVVLTLPLAAFRLTPGIATALPEATSLPLPPHDPAQPLSLTPPAGSTSLLASKSAGPSALAGVSLLLEPAQQSEEPVAFSAAGLPPCDRLNRKSSRSHFSSNSSDNGNKFWRVSWSDNECSVDLVAKGDVKFNADFSDVTEISSGGYLEITVREGEATRRLELRPQGGTLRRTYSINGNPATYDDTARAWLAAFLVDLDRHTGFAVDSRLPALLKQGVSAVLDEIDQMGSDYARGLYYRKLFASVRLSQSELRRAARTAGTTMESDYELGRVLAALAEQYPLADAEVRTAFIDAAGTLESDYERAQLLLVVIAKGAVTPESGRTIVKLAGGMSSDYEKARVLMALGESRLVDPKTAAPDYLEVVAGMESDYERGRVLKLIVGSGQLSRESLIRVLDVTRTMSSDYEAASVLVGLASHNAVDGEVRDAYLKAADRLKSDYESQRARSAVRKP